MGIGNNKGLSTSSTCNRRQSSRLQAAAAMRDTKVKDAKPEETMVSPNISTASTNDCDDAKKSRGYKRKRMITPSPSLAMMEFVEEEGALGNNPHEYESQRKRGPLPIAVLDLDATPTRRLFPVRSRPEDENTLFVQEYGQEFYSSLMNAPHYLFADQAGRNGLSVEERSVVVSMLAGIIIQRKLSSSTLHLAVQLMTRYFALNDAIPALWTREKYIIVATIACFLVAHKIEEVELPPLLKDEINVGLLEHNNVTKSLKRQDVLDAETRICGALEFRFHKTTPLSYIDRFIHASAVGNGCLWPSTPNKIFSSLVLYLIDVSLLSKDLVSTHSSLVAAAAVYLARCTLGITCPKGIFWNDTLAYYTSYGVSDLRKPVTTLHKEQCSVNNEQKNKIYRKYCKEENHWVSQKAAPLQEMLFPEC